jgi:hypothetical protein
MNVFIQGMRRSGTTILFDLFVEDGSFECWYEPLAAADRKAVGGGSGARGEDYFEKVRQGRAAFLALHPEIGDTRLLNYGAPRDHRLELEPDAPGFVRDYIRFMAMQREDTLIKFTRMYCKIPLLAEIDPRACLIHVVRDPRAVTASYLFGRDRRNERIYGDPDAFFGRTSSYTAWSSGPLSDAILESSDYRHLGGCEDFMRILLIWAYTFRATREAGRRAFGERYLLLRLEDLQVDPAAALARLYGFLDRPVPGQVANWARRAIRAPEPPFAADDPRWHDAFRRLGIERDLALMGLISGGRANSTEIARQQARPVPMSGD